MGLLAKAARYHILTATDIKANKAYANNAFNNWATKIWDKILDNLMYGVLDYKQPEGLIEVMARINSCDSGEVWTLEWDKDAVTEVYPNPII